MRDPVQILRRPGASSRLIRMGILSAAFLAGSCAGTSVPGPEPAILGELGVYADPRLAAPGPYGVRITEGRRISVYGKIFAFDVFEPDSSVPIGTILIAHGFARNRLSMRGWGRHLAGHGFRVIVPDLVHSTPFAGRHDRNARDLLDLASARDLVDPATARGPGEKPRTFRAYLGFSAGGLASFLAFLQDPEASCWIGLDPVDSKGMASSALSAPGVEASARTRLEVSRAFLGESSSCNARGNFGPILDDAKIPVVRIPGAPHQLFEDPYDPGLEVLCGRPASGEVREALRNILRARVTGELLSALRTRTP